jgi:transmembrane sensor|uniref:FecR family protein n=1 Tax=Cephaloticoccus sp. TaxID=1985742 RepID=UPI004049EE55
MPAPSNPTPEEQSRPVSRAAARWLVLHDRGLTPEEQDEFFDWLAADPRHGEWYERQRATWQKLNKLVMWCPEHSAEPNPDLLNHNVSSRQRTQRWHWRGALALAAAAVAVLLAVGPSGLRPTPATAGRPPSIEWVAQGFERRQLEDGSMVELTGGTRLWLEYTATERRLRLLEGEAHFTVARNAARPFVVSVSGVDLRALGTAFNVRAGPGQVEVVVTHGRVQVLRLSGLAAQPDAAGGGEAPVLLAGDSALFSLDGGAPDLITRVSEEEMSRWAVRLQPRVFDFNATPLGLVAEEFNRAGGKRLIIADERLKALPIVLSFRSDNVEGFVRLLELTTEVRVEYRGDAIVLRSAAAK